MTAEERRALLGEDGIRRAQEIVASAPPLRKDSERYRRLALLLRRARPVVEDGTTTAA